MECRRHVVNESSNEYQANASMTNDNGLSIAFGGYAQISHLDCIQRRYNPN
jgi:hypothetical protein